MDSFKQVCEGCPLRTKVNIDRAQQTTNWNSEGVSAVLSDGNEVYRVPLANGEFEDSDELAAIDRGVQESIATCEGPDSGILRRKCGVGLARAWRGAEEIGHFESNITEPEDIIPLLDQADWTDAMPSDDRPTWYAGELRELSAQECGERSAFVNYGIYRLASTVAGTRAMLPEGRAVILDRVSRVSDLTMEDIFRIRAAQNGPSFTFRSGNTELGGDTTDWKHILAEGIYGYLHSNQEELEESERLDRSAEQAAMECFAEIYAYLDSDDFLS